jgi:galactose mutarotase-like enzyme
MPPLYNLTEIKSEGLTATICPFGSELYALKDTTGRDLLWGGDPAVWRGRAPLLFPIVGSLVAGEYRLSGRSYPLPRHGFARNRLFHLVDATVSTANFRLHWDEETMQVYPFHFVLEVRFTLNGSALAISASVKNLGDVEMTASFGFHPALRWPMPFGQPRSAHCIQFEKGEPAPIRRVDNAGLLVPEKYPTPISERTLRLNDDLFVDDALIFDQIASRRVWYGAEEGPRIQIEFPDTPYLGVWTKPGADFICIEPWHGYSDPVGFSGDFRNKPGVFMVGPHQTKHCEMTITVCH